MRLRRARPEDALALAHVHVRSWRAAYQGLLPQAYLDGLDVTKRSHGWQRILAQTDWPSAGTWLAEDNGEVIGFVNICPARDEDENGVRPGEVTAIYVLPEEWGKGTGAALMAAGLGSLAEAGYSQAALWVLDTNKRARRFYEKRSWLADGALKRDDSHGIWLSEVRYVRPLS